MKKIAPLLCFLLFTMTAFSQTLTINDFKELVKGGDANKILTSKSFIAKEVKRPHKKKQILYVINDNTPHAESIELGPDITSTDGTVLRDVNYMSADTNYVNRIMKQINMAGIELTGKNIEKSQTTYTFDNKKLSAQVIIDKLNASKNIIQLHPKPQLP
ncbi:MAG TPA: hypothetical protein VGI43_07725 [Mucilaginibacter sp.]|jgi:hypothetical protein